LPIPGWYPDPTGAPQWRFWDGRQWTVHVSPYFAYAQRKARPALDAAVDQMRAADDAPWGWRPVVVPIAAFLIVIIGAPFVAQAIDPTSYNGKVVFAVAANFVVEVLIAASVWFAGRGIASRYGGWGRAFGWRWPRWIDLGYGALTLVGVFIARIVVGVVANVVTNGDAVKEAQNLEVTDVTVVAVVLLVVLTVICAPVIEELVFRGLLLRTFMRRMGFWPAALLSTLIFGLFHTYEVETIAGAVTLALSVACLGLGNCILNRYTNRLAGGIGVHAVFNLVAVVVVIAMA
jgi:membrane protease YdiL (CAAX protease family)